MDCCSAFPKVLTEPPVCTHHLPKGCPGILVLQEPLKTRAAFCGAFQELCARRGSAVGPEDVLHPELFICIPVPYNNTVPARSFQHSVTHRSVPHPEQQFSLSQQNLHFSCYNGNGQTEASELSAEPFLADAFRAALPSAASSSPAPLQSESKRLPQTRARSLPVLISPLPPSAPQTHTGHKEHH